MQCKTGNKNQEQIKLVRVRPRIKINVAEQQEIYRIHRIH